MKRMYRQLKRRLTVVLLVIAAISSVLICNGVIAYVSETEGTWKTSFVLKCIGLTAFIVFAAVAAWFLSSPKGTGSAHLVHAGNWIMQVALRQADQLSKREHREKTGREVRRELDLWLQAIKHDLFDGSILQTSEMARDLELAKDFQLAYLNRPYPKVPAVHLEGRLRLIFNHRYEPALALGGDFFDILALGPDAAGVFLADVMGHGTRSALLTAVLRTQLRDIAERGRNPPLFMAELNQQFTRMLRSLPEPLFASAFYFLADTTARVATFSSAGHPSPFYIRRGPKRVGQVTRLNVSEPRGAALGLVRKEKYSAGHIRLVPGDVFIFFTDGLYEAHNPRGEELGLGALNEIIRDIMYKKSADIVNDLVQSVYDFQEGEPVMDDICVVAVEVTDKAEDPTFTSEPTDGIEGEKAPPPSEIG